MRQTLLFLFVFGLKTALAQPAENLTTSQPFFEKAAVVYQKWLDANGLGELLRVQSVEVQKDTLLMVFLGFQTADADSARAMWKRVHADYFLKTGGEALETLLFEKVAWYFETPADQCRLYFRDSYAGKNAVCWEARVVPKNGQPFWEDREWTCKSQDFPLEIRPVDLSGMTVPTATDFQKKWGKKEVFEKLEPWLVTRFSKPQPDGGWSHIHFTRGTPDLKFEVDDLRKEVITTAQSSWLCELIGQTRSCLPYENLEIVLKYRKLADTLGGFELTATVSAKYGSAIWKPREGGWHDLDDEPAKKALLKKYGTRLMSEIFEFLTKP